MSDPGTAIVVEPDEPPDDSPDITSTRTVEVGTLAVLLAFAVLMMWDNWRTGAAWESTGPQAGYFPFYVAIILAGACVYGIGREIAVSRRVPSEGFVTVNQMKRVLAVLVPTVLFVPVTSWLGLYVASFLLIAGFMRVIGRIAWWKAIVTALVFSVAMFVTFEIAFDVIMPKGPLEHLFGY
ncbi:MAG TPA: tripartite tricarboxylate transporter TctB family protein [Usitatibacter sp.]|nr:tripartite tricarboxylate transporter TctB family protein [Usitatibacter sp.]